MCKTLLPALLCFLIIQKSPAQLPDRLQKEKLTISFNKNIEFLGFLYFIAYEGTNSETKTLEIDGKQILEKDWQNYGYHLYQKYKHLAENKDVLKAMSIAEHLWLDDLWPLLLQVQDFPRANLHAGVDERYYLLFSKTKDKEEGRKNAEIFLSALNEVYKDVNFDKYLAESFIYYQSALSQVQRNILAPEFISFTENFYRKTFSHYLLVPSLTIPKGMGFGPRLTINGETSIYNIFGAVDFQRFSNTNDLDMGFGNQDRLRELSVHEFGHSFVNPEIERIPNERIERTAPLFEPLRSVMENQGYNNWKGCLIEHFVRAGELVIAEKMGNVSSTERLRNEYLNDRKFIYIPVIIEELKRFEANKSDNYQNVIDRVLLRLEKEVSNTTQKSTFSNNPRDAKFYTEDITAFWKIFDENYPKLPGEKFQQEYLDKGSAGLKGFIKNRIESGKHLSKTVREKLKYYEYIRSFTMSISEKKDRLYECFENLKKIYPNAVFPDVYFVIGADNTGGTVFNGGLIIGAERFGKENDLFKPALDIDYVDEVVAHELIHFQQKYVKDNSLLAQSVREGSADFLCELIAGSHSNKVTYQYGDNHRKELWEEFKQRMYQNDWSGWLYYNKDKSRAKDLGYWMGYQICKAYFNRMHDKQKAIADILNIDDFKKFFEESRYNGE